MSYQVGAIEAVLQARLDDRNFDKFDRAVAAAKRSVDSMSAGQMRQAAAMKKAGVATADIAKKLGVSEKAMKDYGRSQDRARQSTERLGRATKTTGSQMQSAVRYAIGLAAAYVGIGQAKAAITTTLDFNKAVQGLNRNLGLTIEQASRWATVAKARDIDTKSLVMSFTSLSKKIEEGKAGGEGALGVFNSLGISQRELTTGGQGFQAQLEKVAVALGDAEGGTNRQAAAQQLLGRGYQTVLPLFTQGTESLKEQLKWADEFGTVLSKKTSGGLGDVTEQLRRSKAAMLALQISFTTAAGPAVEYLNEQFQGLTKTMNDPSLTSQEKINRISGQIEKILNRVGSMLEKAAPQIAEQAGRIGIAIAKGIVQAFLSSGWLGKLAIGTWLVAKMGGFAAIAGIGGRVGGRLAKSMGKRFLAVVGPYLGATGLGGVLAAKMGRLRGAFGSAGAVLGRTMAGRLVRALSLPGLLLGLVMLIPEKTRAAALAAGNSIGRSISNGIKEGLQSLVTDLPGGSVISDAIGGIFDLNARMSAGGGKHGGLVTPGGVVGMKHGGRVPGLHPDDTVPAMLEPGEFVMRKKTVDKVGVPFLRTLNDKGEVGKESKKGQKEIGETFERLGKETKRRTEKTEKQVVKTFGTMRKKTVDSQNKLKRSVQDSWRDIDLNHTRRTASMDQATGKRFGGMLKTVRSRGGDMRQSMGDTMGSLQSSVLGGMTNIAKQTNRALKAFGVNPVNFGVGEKKGQYAGGGYIPGRGKQDTVPLVMGMAAPGEAILSGPQQAQVEQSLAMTRALGLGDHGSLNSLFANVTTPHYAYARGGFLGGVRKFATGGFPELDPAARGLAQQLQGMGFTPSSTYRSDSSTYHGSRDAMDYGDASSSMPRLWSILKPRAQQFAELFGPSYLSGPTLMHNGVGFSDSGLQAGHEDHIHVAIVNGLMGGLSPVQIKEQILSGPDGALKSLGQAGLDKVLTAAQKYVSKKQAAMSGGHSISADGDVAGIFASTLRQFGANKKVALALFQAGLAESGMRDLSYGHSTSLGSLQLLSSTASSMGIDPHDEGQVASAFLTRGYYLHGGAMEINREDPSIPAHMIAQMVQGSAFSDGSNYLAQKAPALQLLSRFGFARGGRIPGFSKGGKPDKVFMPTGGARPDGKPSGSFFSSDRLKAMRAAGARRRAQLAQKKARWDRFRKGQINLGKSSRDGGEMTLPRLLKPFRPLIGPADQSDILAAHSPISGDLGAYNTGSVALGNIDSQLAELRAQYLGTYSTDTSQSVFKQQEQIRRNRERAERAMRKRYEAMMGGALRGGQPTGGVRPDGKPSVSRKPSDKQARKIRAGFQRAIKRQTAVIRRRHNPASALRPLAAQRIDLQSRFGSLSERGSAVSDLVAQAQTNVRNTARVSSNGSRAFAGFASGGFVGQPMAVGGGAPVIHVTLADPTLAALNPHIEATVNGQMVKVGQATKQRQRAAGSSGRRMAI